MKHRWLAHYHCDDCDNTWKVGFGHGCEIKDMVDFCDSCLKKDPVNVNFAEPYIVEKDKK